MIKKSILLILCFFLMITPKEMKAQQIANYQLEDFINFYQLPYPVYNSRPENGLCNYFSVSEETDNSISSLLNHFPDNYSIITLEKPYKKTPDINLDSYIYYDIENHGRLFIFCNAEENKIIDLFPMRDVIKAKVLQQLTDQHSSLHQIYHDDYNMFYNPLVSSETCSFHAADDGKIYAIHYVWHEDCFHAVKMEERFDSSLPYVFQIIRPCDFPIL